ncbi:hypothetical protein H6G80_04025 [Nostoc sp. FACHB-87]|uniref:hypothetical protein n=1 Tax=Nostocaceae TaxID=1162 RepID=UPI0016841431|nr:MULTISPECIES: hypothetical protein [Nostocaceae]MBD2298932.1 hypothetical protein [Nostoc sp. FACHB-190]MBD2453242.1 hypothetical protein [Nostoc sp. FACHB-87]MBD2474978.1 hypothetical protein [Anabaena sp. FACHB-83]
MTRYKKLLQRIEEQRQKEQEFNKKVETVIASVNTTLKRIDTLDAEIAADAQILHQWSHADQ